MTHRYRCPFRFADSYSFAVSNGNFSFNFLSRGNKGDGNNNEGDGEVVGGGGGEGGVEAVAVRFWTSKVYRRGRNQWESIMMEKRDVVVWKGRWRKLVVHQSSFHFIRSQPLRDDADDGRRSWARWSVHPFIH